MQFSTNPNNVGNWTIPNPVHPVLQPQQITVPNMAQPQSSLIWVEGEQGVNNYPVARGNTILLLDSQDSMFYLKSSDLTGNISIRKFKFEEVNPPQNTDPKEEVDMISQLHNDIESMSSIIGDFSSRLDKFESETVEQIRNMEDKINRISYKSTWKNKTYKEKDE